MKSRFCIYLLAGLMTIAAVACGAQDAPGSQLPNPASAYCQEQGYQVEIRTAADGSQQGFCIFPDGNECEEWAFYRGECSPETSQE